MKKGRNKFIQQISSLSDSLTQYEARRRLREYLSRYDTVVKSKDSLAEQLRTVITSVGSVRSEAGKRKLGEFEARLEEEKIKAIDIANEIKTIIAYLPLGSTPRQILELRYITRYSWRKVCTTVHIERSRVAEIESNALDDLLKVEAVRAKIVHN